MEHDENKLRLIYVLKIGYNAKDEGLYEFIFSLDPTNVLVEDWMWDTSPACDNADPPTEEYVDAIFNLKTSSFNLFCLHEAVDREYMHGYHTIHALAYEKEDEYEDTSNVSSYDSMFEQDNDDVPLLVFHYGTTLKRIMTLLDSRKIILKGNEFIESSSLNF